MPTTTTTYTHTLANGTTADAGDVMDNFNDIKNFCEKVDEDTMASNSATAMPTQQSVVAYVTAQLASAVCYQDVRLTYTSATEIALTGMAGTSGLITVNDENVDCSTAKTLAPTDNLITAAGLDVGSAPAVDTLYYAYVSNASATVFSSSLRLSATGPTSGYLATSGNGANWKFVGWVRTIDSTGAKFASSVTQRLVCSKFNPRLLGMEITEASSHTYTTTTWRKWNNADGTLLKFIVHEDFTVPILGLTISASGDPNPSNFLGIGIDGTTPLLEQLSYDYGCTSFRWGTPIVTASLAAGYHYAQVLEYGSGSSSTLAACWMMIWLWV